MQRRAHETRRSSARSTSASSRSPRTRRIPPSCASVPTPTAGAIALSIADYESIRSSPTRFPVKPGHVYVEFERVVEENGHYIVVEKFGAAGEIVKELDTRSRS